MNPKSAFLTIFIAFSAAVGLGQGETVTNEKIVEMVRNGISNEVVSAKLLRSRCFCDTSPQALIELKKSGVSEAIMRLMIERAVPLTRAAEPESPRPSGSTSEASFKTATPRDLVRSARTIALVKSSLQPSRQALEKEIMKRAEWPGLNLTIVRYRDEADLYVEIGYVSLSWITHRYVYRIFDRRTGVIVAAGETTSWGSLAENLAKHITRSLRSVSNS